MMKSVPDIEIGEAFVTNHAGHESFKTMIAIPSDEILAFMECGTGEEYGMSLELLVHRMSTGKTVPTLAVNSWMKNSSPGMEQ